jgi:hypothetical protein
MQLRQIPWKIPNSSFRLGYGYEYKKKYKNLFMIIKLRSARRMGQYELAGKKLHTCEDLVGRSHEKKIQLSIINHIPWRQCV